jgi:hypothetical protein
MPITIIPDTGVNNIYINSDTGRNVIISGIAGGGAFGAKHNSLLEIQGGATGEYYHLTAEEYANLNTGLDGSLYYLNNNPSGFISTQEAEFRFVNVTGNESVSGQKRFFDNIFFESGIDITGFINFYLNQQTSPLEGQVGWHPDYGTVQIGMNGGDVINPVGFKNFYRVKASEAIRKGKVVMAAGSVGNSEFILAKEAHGIGPSGELIMGVASEDISQNEFGDVVAFGAVKGINTSSYPVDSILYYDPAVTGGLTPQIPEAPNAKVIVGLNTSQANNGTVFVRVSAGSQLGVTDSNVKFTSLNDKDVLLYNLNSGVWLNRQINTGDISGASDFVTKSETGVFYPISNPSGFITGVELSGYSTINFSTGISGYLQSEISLLQQNTGSYYLNSNPSGFITGVDLSSYATINFTTGISGELQGKISSLENNTGNYYLNSNPSGFITGVDLSSYATIDFTTGISGELQQKISSLENNTGNYYLNSNPSGFITGVNLSNYATIPFVTGISGNLDSKIQILYSQTGLYVTGNVIRPSDTGQFYPTSNPSGFIGNSGLSGYATIDFTTGISGYLQSQISGESQTPNSVQNIIGSSLFL